MKTIDVQNQFRLGAARTFNLTVSGIRYRLFRSSVTVVVIAVAIAFLMNVLSEGLIQGAIGRMTRRRIREERQAPRWAARLSVTATPQEILQEVARGEPDSPRYVESMRLGKLSPDEMRSYYKRARTAVFYVDYFRGLLPAPRRILVKNATGVGIFDRFQDPGEFKRLLGELARLKSLMFPTAVEDFRAFLDDWPELYRTTLRIQRGLSEAQALVKEKLGGRSVMEGVAEADGSFGQAVREAGFVLDDETAASVAEQARQILDMRHLEATVLVPEMRKAVAAYENVMPAEVNALTLWKLLRSRGASQWYFEKLKEKGVGAEMLKDGGAVGTTAVSARPGAVGTTAVSARPGAVGSIDIERARYLASRKASNDALTRGERNSADVGGGFMGIGQRMTWLVLMAMLVCVTGVANAMLMSVTERFREIATLKCLGALDGSIMLMFVMEAALLGAAGGVAGATAGSIIGLGRMFIVFGWLLFTGLPGGQILMAVLISSASGVVLAAIAAVYPSFRAARLAPMEAMRIQ